MDGICAVVNTDSDVGLCFCYCPFHSASICIHHITVWHSSLHYQ